MLKRTVVLGLGLLLLVSVVAAQGRGPGNQGCTGCPGCAGVSSQISELPLDDIDDAERTDLIFMREEEKLARDVYFALDAQWGMRVFGNIAGAEQTHMNAILSLLERYGIEDPVGDNPAGVFADTRLQELYGQLVEYGSVSLLAALEVGATIEDLDIADLAAALERTDNADVATVWQNLQKGSRNHLRSFVRLLESNGATYEPQYLSPLEFEDIVESPMERGALDANGDPVTTPGCPSLKKRGGQRGASRR